MRKIIYLLMALVIPLGVARAQETSYFDTPFGGGIGFIPGWMKPNLDGLNTQVKSLGIPEVGKHGIFTSGGSGFLYLGIIKNLRIGGMWAGGSTSEKAFVPGVAPLESSYAGPTGAQKEADYEMSIGAFTAEYTLPFIKNMGVSVGLLIGAGTQKLDIYQSRGPAEWSQVWNDFSSDNNLDETHSLQNSFFIIAPTVNVDIPLYRFISVRAGAGYLLKYGGTWKLDNDREILNVPKNLTKDCLYVQTGIFIGFFSF